MDGASLAEAALPRREAQRRMSGQKKDCHMDDATLRQARRMPPTRQTNERERQGHIKAAGSAEPAEQKPQLVSTIGWGLKVASAVANSVKCQRVADTSRASALLSSAATTALQMDNIRVNNNNAPLRVFVALLGPAPSLGLVCRGQKRVLLWFSCWTVRHNVGGRPRARRTRRMKDPEFRKCNQAGRIFMRLTARSAGSSSGQPSSSPLEGTILLGITWACVHWRRGGGGGGGGGAAWEHPRNKVFGVNGFYPVVLAGGVTGQTWHVRDDSRQERKGDEMRDRLVFPRQASPPDGAEGKLRPGRRKCRDPESHSRGSETSDHPIWCAGAASLPVTAKTAAVLSKRLSSPNSIMVLSTTSWSRAATRTYLP
ncbi:hypothetical protein VDGL01_04543 [Verticillium dahliae]